MTPQQLAILNSLVTYAAENIPGGLAEDEREVARIVGAAALTPNVGTREYNYKVVNASSYHTLAATANASADHGWRVVAAVSSRGPGYSHELILERPVGMTHPDD